MKKESLADLDILRLIPQRAPMVMVSGLLAADKHSITTFFLVDDQNIFLKDGLFRESGLIENIAQSAATLNGFRAYMDMEPVKNGYIGAIKNLEIARLPRAGQRLTTVVTETYQVMDTSIIEGVIRVSDEFIARCEMKVFMQP